MTEQELKQIYYTSLEVNRLYEKIEMFRDKATDISQKYNAISVKSSTTSDKVGNYAIMIAQESEELDKYCNELKDRVTKGIGFIHSIEDSQLRLIMEYRFIDFLSWDDIADKIGGGNSPDSCRKRVSRYFGDDDIE